MIHLFIDETGDRDNKKYFGLCCIAINHTFYSRIKSDFQNILIRNNWNPAIEFKGSYLFSASKGCTEIPVDQRIDICEEILNLNYAEKNARMQICFYSGETDNTKDEYLSILPKLIEKTLTKCSIQPKAGKNLVSVNCDFRDDITITELRTAVLPVILKRHCFLFEDVSKVKSNFETIGILYADIIGYLLARIETISNDSELFENLSPEAILTNGKFLKLRSSISLIHKVKQITQYTIRH